MGSRPLNLLLVLLAIVVAAGPLRITLVAPLIHAAESDDVARMLNRLHSRHHVDHHVDHHADHHEAERDGRTHADDHDHHDDCDHDHEEPADHHCLLDHLPDAPEIRWTTARRAEIVAPPALPSVVVIAMPAPTDWALRREPKPPPWPPAGPRHPISIKTTILRL